MSANVDLPDASSAYGIGYMSVLLCKSVAYCKQYTLSTSASSPESPVRGLKIFTLCNSLELLYAAPFGNE